MYTLSDLIVPKGYDGIFKNVLGQYINSWFDFNNVNFVLKVKHTIRTIDKHVS